MEEDLAITTMGYQETSAARELQERDLAAITAIDERLTGRRRAEYLRLKLQEAMAGIRISLVFERDGLVVGFLFARVYYGEFGLPEPVAVLDTIGVKPDFQHAGVGASLLDQLRTNLRGLGIRKLQTEVAWDDQALCHFFQRSGFQPAARLCLDLDLFVV